MPAETEPSSPDPTLDILVPRTTWRATAVAVVAVGVLVLAGVVGAGSRVSLATGGGSSSLLPDRRVELTTDVVASGWPGLTLAELTPPVGARLVHVWAVPASEVPSGDLGQRSVVGVAEASGLPDSLPVRLAPGQHYQLVTLLEITDCAAYAVSGEGQGWVVDPAPDPHAAVAHLRTALGTRADVPLLASMWTADDLAQYSSCPAAP
ncbi:hypothetical protein Q6346_11500 [Isoptericola sp. b490]|uniref:hypothetical protein n=1 Tax=Actinotalea lenta TaxID=3064654 RepID=UPI0027133C97|nr:hypothetical protein [Isoptericola sp. b490]MDO8121935.1 hypothetical protein [Isoptericola sp. b490]